MADNAYTHPVSQLLTLGECSPSRWLDYRALGLGPGDVPELIRMALDPGLNQASTESEAVWAPTHAWRALGQLEAAEAAEPLLELLDELDQDDWALEEIPEVMGLIGPAAIPALRGFLAQPDRREFARVGAADALKEIGARHSAARDVCVAALTEQLAACEDGVDSLNGFLVGDLLDLGGREALSAMEAAFEAGVVDEAVAGGWQEVRRRFNLAPSREELPGRPPPDLFARRPQDGHTTSRAARSKRKKKLAKASRRKNRRK